MTEFEGNFSPNENGDTPIYVVPDEILERRYAPPNPKETTRGSSYEYAKDRLRRASGGEPDPNKVDAVYQELCRVNDAYRHVIESLPGREAEGIMAVDDFFRPRLEELLAPPNSDLHDS